MIRIIQIGFVLVFLLVSATSLAQLLDDPHGHSHAHSHDQGELLIMQQGQSWNIQFVIPAINAFGFEHLPENKQQKQLIEAFIDKITTPNKVISFDGKCQLLKVDEAISSLFLADKKHNKDHHHGHHHSEDKHQQQEVHLDVKFGYLFECVTNLSTFDIQLFKSLKGLQQFSVQWITNQGQGASNVDMHSPRFMITK